MTEAKPPAGWPEKFQDNEYVSFRPPMSEAAARWWNGRFLNTVGLYPETFIDAIAAGAPGVIKGRFNALDHEAETFEVEIEGKDTDLMRIFLKKKRFEISDRKVGEGETQVHPDHQGRGIGTGLMLNLIDLAGRLEMDEVDIEAEDVGRYAWLSLGFLPDATSWRRHIVPAATQRLKLAVLRAEIDDATARKAFAILAEPDPRAARELFLLREPVPGDGPRGARTMVPLSRALMLTSGTEWLGTFNLRDETSLRFFAVAKEEHHVRYSPP